MVYSQARKLPIPISVESKSPVTDEISIHQVSVITRMQVKGWTERKGAEREREGREQRSGLLLSLLISRTSILLLLGAVRADFTPPCITIRNGARQEAISL